MKLKEASIAKGCAVPSKALVRVSIEGYDD